MYMSVLNLFHKVL